MLAASTAPGTPPQPSPAGRLYDYLAKAADEGGLCPSNEAIAAFMGYSSPSASSAAVKQLERRGLVRVQRFSRSRIIEIIFNGKRTAKPQNTAPHWRDRPQP